MNEQVKRIEDGEKREFYGKYCLQFDSTVFNDVYKDARNKFESWRHSELANLDENITYWLELEEGKSNIYTILNGKKDDVTIDVVGKVGLDDDVENDGKLFDNDITGHVKIFMDEGDRKEFALLYLKSDIRREEIEKDTGRVRGLDNQVFHLTIARNGEPKRIPVKIIATFFTDNDNDNEYTPVIKLVVDKAEETVQKRIEEGGAPRKSRRARKSRKASKKSKKSGRKSQRRSRR
jgi:hypothetical protein